jgi:phosphoribosylanthranilate isomerase
VKIKICGLFRDEDIDAVNEALPDYAGFVFAPSRRQVSEEEARRLRSRLSPQIIPVGIFVNAPPDTIARLYEADIIRAAQLHGTEDSAYLAGLRSRGALPLIKALTPFDLINPCWPERCAPANFLLFDAGRGSGATFDWRLFLAARVICETPSFLAGGISRDNIDQAIALNPFGIDISSGAESGGLKDREKIRFLVSRAREAASTVS